LVAIGDRGHRHDGIANLQHAWTLFITPLTQSLGATLAAVQVAFAAFVLAATWLVPFAGALVDYFGPRGIIMVGGILVGLGWIGSGLTGTTRLTNLTRA
jgi:OFA family oxalate/formate antiporter-like MFS transporter